MKPDQILNDIKLCIGDQIYESAPSEIYVPPDRQRKAFDEKALAELSRRLLEEGQHTPGLCFRNETGAHQLIFGERRLRACAMAGLPFRYQLANSLPDAYTLAVIEFSENIAREDLTWREEADAKAALHRLFQERYGEAKLGPGGSGHSLRDTAAYLKKSLGNVAEDIELSGFAAVIPEVAQAKNKTEAKKLVERLKTEVKRDLVLENARQKAEAAREDLVVTPSGEPLMLSEFEQKLAYFDQRVLLGRMEDLLPTLPPPSVVIFDPPWGVEIDTVASIGGEKKAYADNRETFLERFPLYAQLLYDVMPLNSHLYLFFGIVHHSFIYDTLEQVGFETNRMPLFWHKLGSHRTRQPDRWPGRCYEAIAFAHKGLKPLVRRGQPDIISTPAPTPTMKGSHPSAKHPDIYRDLLLRSCEPGATVLDPMAGSGMFGVACESLSKQLALSWLMIELDEDFRNLAMFNLARGYEALVGDTAPPIDDLPSDFRELTPGTEKWTRYWDTHPDEQPEMLAWRTEQTEKPT